MTRFLSILLLILGGEVFFLSAGNFYVNPPFPLLRAEETVPVSSESSPDSFIPWTRGVDPSPDLRLDFNDRRIPRALLTPILRFHLPETGQIVDLIGAVHFADRTYYEELNRLFTDYDAVLVEMVLPSGTKLSQIPAPVPPSPSDRIDSSRPSAPSPVKKPLEKTPKKQSNRSPQKSSNGKGGGIGAQYIRFQKGLGKTLGLTNQLDVIDYHAPNMVRADIDSETLSRRLIESGDLNNTIQNFLFDAGENKEESPTDQGAVPVSSDGKGGNSPASFESLGVTGFLLSSNRRLTFRRAFAIQMAEGIHDPPLFEKSLIKERNEVALAELSRQLDSGKERIALFYGAAHLPDLTDHLLTDFPTEKTEIRWLTAWKLD